MTYREIANEIDDHLHAWAGLHEIYERLEPLCVETPEGPGRKSSESVADRVHEFIDHLCDEYTILSWKGKQEVDGRNPRTTALKRALKGEYKWEFDANCDLWVILPDQDWLFYELMDDHYEERSRDVLLEERYLILKLMDEDPNVPLPERASKQIKDIGNAIDSLVQQCLELGWDTLRTLRKEEADDCAQKDAGQCEEIPAG